jgi:hypothetical protein
MSEVWTGTELLLWGGRATTQGATFALASDGARFAP